MTDRWAALLANASQPDNEAVLPSFTDVLRELTPVEAKLLDLAFDVAMRFAPSERASRGAVGEALRQAVALSEPAFVMHVENLYRLRLAAPPTVGLSFTTNPESRYQLAGYDLVCLTHFGEAFVRACRPPGQDKDDAKPTAETYEQRDAELGRLTYDDLKGQPPEAPPRRISIDDIDPGSLGGMGA